MESYKIASALRGVIAQRLMRRLCPTCKQESADTVPEKLRRHVPAGQRLFRAVGCPDCAMTGYRGRFCIVEVLTMSPELERRIGAGATADRIAEAARAGGMRSLWESGLRHVLDGESTIEELLRVTDVPTEEQQSLRASVPTPRPAAPEPPPAPARPGYLPPAEPDFGFTFDLVEDILPPVEPRGGPGRGRCVLLVEDEDQLRRVMKDLLEREGYKVAEARDGAQALDEVDRSAPDLIMLDLNLPGLDGYGVLERLRSRSSTSAIPVIVLTAKGDEDNEVRVFQLGADDFLTKPFRARALSARLDAVMNRKRAAS
jgi:CheY-like chemotaxis protein